MDMESIQDLREIFMHYLKSKKSVSVDLTKISYISGDGKAFLKEFSDRIIIQES